MKFLIIQTAFLGDVILATPVASELKRIYPNCKISFLLRKGNEDLLSNHESIDEIIVLDKKAGKFKELRRIKKIVKNDSFHEIINLHRFAFSGLITFLLKADGKIGYDKNPFSFIYSRKIKHIIGDGTHEVERNLKCIKHHGAYSKIRPSLFPNQNDFDKIENYTTEKFVIMAPASVWFTKQLPEHKWVELIQKNQHMIYLIGGPNDYDLCQRIAEKANSSKVKNLAGKLKYLETCALMSYSEMCFVNDSGPMHMASAMNAPTTAFYCATIPTFGFGPLSDLAKIVENSEKLPCRPCGLHGSKVCPKGHFKCGNGINV